MYFKIIFSIIFIFNLLGSGCSDKKPENSENLIAPAKNLLTPEKTFGAGYANNCYIKPDNLVECQVSPWLVNKPEDINSSRLKAKALTSGLAHNCAILLDDTVSCWNDKQIISFGRRPPHTHDPRASFSVIENKKVLDIAAGDFFTCAIKASDNEIACWGDNTHGQITNIMKRFKNIKLKYISGGGDIMCGIKIDDTLICSNYEHDTGIKAKDVKTNGSAICALGENKLAQCWNLSSYTGEAQDFFEREIKDKEVISLALSHESACFLLTGDQKLHCLGANNFGQLEKANIEKANASKPKAIFAGFLHFCSLGQDNKLFCWGWDDESLVHMKNTQGAQIKFK